jgi:hypothetical protein
MRALLLFSLFGAMMEIIGAPTAFLSPDAVPSAVDSAPNTESDVDTFQLGEQQESARPAHRDNGLPYHRDW